MRAKLTHHAAEWLPGEFEPPELLRNAPHLIVWRVHRNERAGCVAMKLQRGTGVWNTSGKLLFYVQRGADMAWGHDVTTLWSLECKFGRCVDRPGVPHLLKRLDARTFAPLDQLEICVPTGGVRYFVPSHSQSQGLATWLDQTQWGYVMLDLARWKQTAVDLYWKAATLSPPDFAPDDHVIVSCNYFRGAWWNDEPDDPAERRSPGGRRKVGTISVQDVSSSSISHHDVFVNVRPGWYPDRPYRSEWERIWGPEFISSREFRIWLPDDTIEVLALPLPEKIVIEREIRMVRSWTD